MEASLGIGIGKASFGIGEIKIQKEDTFR